MEASGQGHVTAASPWGMFAPINLIRRMNGPQSRSGRRLRIEIYSRLLEPNSDSQVVQSIS